LLLEKGEEIDGGAICVDNFNYCEDGVVLFSYLSLTRKEKFAELTAKMMADPINNYCYQLCAPPFSGKTATWQLFGSYLLASYPQFEIIPHSFLLDAQRDFLDVFQTSDKTFLLVDEVHLSYRDEFDIEHFWKQLHSYGQRIASGQIRDPPLFVVLFAQHKLANESVTLPISYVPPGYCGLDWFVFSEEEMTQIISSYNNSEECSFEIDEELTKLIFNWFNGVPGFVK
jgi:hypothetical protein